MMRMTMADMADAADQVPGAYRLENADSVLTPPEHVLDATRDAVGGDDWNSYLPLRGLRDMREAIAGRYEADLGLSYDPDREIVVTSGAGEAMLNALLGLINPGDRVFLTNPTYSGMAQRVRLAGGVQSFADLRPSDGRWALDRDAARRAADGARVMFVASPNLPTGSRSSTRTKSTCCASSPQRTKRPSSTTGRLTKSSTREGRDQPGDPSRDA